MCEWRICNIHYQNLNPVTTPPPRPPHPWNKQPTCVRRTQFGLDIIHNVLGLRRVGSIQNLRPIFGKEGGEGFQNQRLVDLLRLVLVGDQQAKEHEKDSKRKRQDELENQRAWLPFCQEELLL